MRAHLRADDGLATPVEMMYLLVFCIVAIVFLGFLGRLHAAGVEVTNAAQAAARAASQAPGLAAAQQAATWVVDNSGLSSRCDDGGSATVQFSPSSSGTWQGGAVTVEVRCEVRNQSLTGLWSPGTRVVVMRDTQPIDRYQR